MSPEVSASERSYEKELLSQSQKLAKIGGWEYVLGDDTIYCTEELFALLGLPAAQDRRIALHEIESLIYEDDKGPLRDKIKVAVKGKVADGKFRVNTGLGKTIWVQVWCEGHFNDDETLYKLAGACQDISAFYASEEPKGTEEELERHHDMMAEAEATAKLGSWKYNFATQKVYYSDNLFSLFGYQPREFENDSERIFEFVDPADTVAIMDTYRQTIADGQTRSVNFRLNHRDGSQRQFASTGRMTRNRKGEDIIVGMVQDVTEMHHVRQELDLQREFVDRLVDASINAISVYDKDRKIVLWNKKAHDRHGISREQALGKTIAEVFKGHDMSWAEERLTTSLKGEYVCYEHPSILKGRYHQTHFIPIKNVQDETEWVFLLSADITDLKQQERELQLQRDFAEGIIQNSADCIFVFDDQLKAVTWNIKCEEYYGVKKEDALGKTLEEIFPETDMSIPTSRLVKALQGETLQYTLESSHVVERYFESNIIPLKDSEGNVTHVLCVLHDATPITNMTQRVKDVNRLLEQKNTELSQRKMFLETLLDSTVDAVAAFDLELRVIAYNKTCADKYGKKKEDVLGRPLLEVFPRLAGSEYVERLQKGLQGNHVYCSEVKNAFDEGFNQNFILPLKEDDQIVGVLAIAHDITETRAAAIKLEELNQQLAAKNNELSRINTELASFSYVASHDLQEPLRKIQAFTSLILSRDLANISESGQDYFRRIQASAGRMQQMINGLLSFSRANTTTQKNLETKNLSEIFNIAVNNLQNTIIEKRAVIEVGSLPTVKIISHQVEQLLEHVLSNAIKFQQEGNTPHIVVNYGVVEGQDIVGEVAMRQKQYHKISVKDNGIGFEPEQADKIFQMFHRLRGRSEFPGTGIGLAICRRIAQNHGGFITAEGETGVGAVFNIFLPV